MTSFWQRQWGTNSIGDYCTILLIIASVWFFRRLLSNYFAGLLFRWLRGVLQKVDRALFNDLVVDPLERFLLILVSVIMLYRLHFPPELNISIYKFDTKDLVNSFGTLILKIGRAHV